MELRKLLHRVPFLGAAVANLYTLTKLSSCVLGVQVPEVAGIHLPMHSSLPMLALVIKAIIFVSQWMMKQTKKRVSSISINIVFFLVLLLREDHVSILAL